jgi:hypothetical protein
MALGLLAAFNEAGVRVPDDVSLIGFDDIPEAAFFSPALTTVHQDFTTLGRRVVEAAAGSHRRRRAGYDRGAPDALHPQLDITTLSPGRGRRQHREFLKDRRQLAGPPQRPAGRFRLAASAEACVLIGMR